MDVMVDLETMGTRPDAPIISIGAVAFDSDGVQETFYVNVNLESAVVEGGAVLDPKTVLWWMDQSDSARAVLRAGVLPIRKALHNFTSFLVAVGATGGVWGNGASFDNVILSEAYRRLGEEAPWPFWRDRCYRTVKAAHADVPLERSGTHHNALDDARTQAEHLIAVNRAAKGVYL